MILACPDCGTILFKNGLFELLCPKCRSVFKLVRKEVVLERLNEEDPAGENIFVKSFGPSGALGE